MDKLKQATQRLDEAKKELAAAKWDMSRERTLETARMMATSEDIHLLPFYFGAAAPAELPEDAKAFMKANEPMTDKIFALIDELGEHGGKPAIS